MQVSDSTGATTSKAFTLSVSQTPSLKTLFSFDGTDGAKPYDPSLVQSFDGNLYGTTTFGGANNAGTFFKISPAGTLTTLNSFDSCTQPNCVGGSNPEGGVTLGSDGNFYGEGGGYNGGAIYKVTPGGTPTALHQFCSDPPNFTDDDFSYGTVAQGADGNFYGVTVGGGANTVGPCGLGLYPFGCGTVFRLTPQGAFTVIHNFCAEPNCADGSAPLARLTPGNDGNLYGTTPAGGTYGYGTIFKITPSGTLTTLHSFDGNDGIFQTDVTTAPLIQAANGNFYGTTQSRGTNGSGTVFEINPAGVFTSLYSISGHTSSVGAAAEEIVQGSDGNFYGAAGDAASNGYGALFRMTSKGALIILHIFGGPDGEYPTGLAQATSGVFYGLTINGGANSDGTAFALSLGLGPFVEAVPTWGKVGRTIQILGTNLTGATAVTFNGVAAAFAVVSATRITATVPVGATSGRVDIVTPNQTLKSNTGLAPNFETNGVFT